MSGCTNGDDEDRGIIVRAIVVSPTLLQEGETAIVEVFVTDDGGDPLPDKTVYLEVVPSTGGSFSYPDVQTGDAGIATVVFTAAEAGTFLIRARAESNPTTIAQSITIEENEAVSESGQLTVSLSTNLIPADGQSSATVAIEYLDPASNPMQDGSPVRLTAGEKFTDVDGDGVWTENVDVLIHDADGDGEWDPVGLIDPIVYTVGGEAQATFTAGNHPGVAYIKITAGEAGRQISDDVTVSLYSDNSIASISLTPEWQRVQVRGTGGVEWARIVAEAFDAHGNPAPGGQPVDFTITEGPGGGESLNGEPAGPVTMFTNSAGQATVTLSAGTIPGTVFIRAKSGQIVSDATQITVRSGPAAVISAGAEECNVPSWDKVGYNNRIVAAVVDQWGNEVADSTAVYFGCEQGLIEGAAETQVVPTVRGKAVTFWNSSEPRDDGIVLYWCETSGGTVADTSFFFESGRPASGSFDTAPDTIVAGQDPSHEVIIEVLDINGVYMVDGYPLDVRVDIGSISSGFLHDGCYQSAFTTRYSSGTLSEDYSYSIPDNGIGGIATITVNAGGLNGFNASHQVVLLTGSADSRTSTMELPATVAHGAAVPVEVVIKDSYGNPLGGHLIELSVQTTGEGSGGTVSGSPKYTNKFGVASGFLFTATLNEDVSIAYLTARDLDSGYGGLVITRTASLNP